MNRLAGIDLEVLRFRLLLIFSGLIPLSNFLSIRLLILILIISIIIDYKGVGKGLWQSRETFFYFLVLLLGLIYSRDLNTGFRVLETSASVLLIPMAFPNSDKLSESKWEKIIQAFIIGLFIACVICLSNAAIEYLRSKNIASFFYYNLTDIIKLQPTYFAYYLIFSITWLIHNLFFGETQSNKFSIAILIMFLFVALILTGGQTAFTSLLLIFSFYFLKFILEKKTTVRKFTISLVCVLVIFMFVFNPNNQLMNDSWDRFDLWDAAINASTNPFWGEGTGDYKLVLNQYYTTHQMSHFANESLNSHNQFIQIYFSNGIIGLLAIVILLGSPIYRSFKMGNPLGILIFFPFLIYGMTEVFMGRYQGVVFFAFLSQVFFSFVDSQRLNHYNVQMK
jgi:O-antigen ligase